jgi:hypothetical protein
MDDAPGFSETTNIWNPFDSPDREHFPELSEAFAVAAGGEDVSLTSIETRSAPSEAAFSFEHQARYLDSVAKDEQTDPDVQTRCDAWFAENARALLAAVR